MFFSCMVQEGQTSPEQRARLEQELEDIAVRVMSVQPGASKFNCVEVKSGFGFTEAKPSTSSLALAIVPDGTAQTTRLQLLQSICDAWMSVTNCSINEIVATAADASSIPRDLTGRN